MLAHYRRDRFVPMGTTFATMVAGVFSLASGLAGDYDRQAGHPVPSSQPTTISIEVSKHAGYPEPMVSVMCAFCTGPT
jgi:hypothetical protein